MIRAIATLALVFAVRLAHAAGSAPAATPPQQPGAAPSAEARYNAGNAFAERGDWDKAEAAYRDATKLKPDFPEAWNGLGHALKGLKRWDDSVRAYQEALRLRPNYPQALEYLGEAYVQMGKPDDARRILAQLKPLDATQAAALERAITGGGGTW